MQGGFWGPAEWQSAVAEFSVTVWTQHTIFTYFKHKLKKVTNYGFDGLPKYETTYSLSLIHI